jgi:outer membrane beta-barrel protein
MESRIRLLLLTAVSIALCGCASLHWPWRQAPPAPAGDADIPARGSSDTPPRVIEPEVERRTVKVPRIHATDVEVGGYYGEISIEDFGAQPVAGLRLDYHITEDFFFEAAYGRAKAGKTSFETLGGNVQLLTADERRFTYYNLSLGYNFLPGEVFLGRNLAMTSGLYLLGGIGSIKFAGDQNFTVNFGAGFRVLPTDWLAIHIDVQDLVYKSSLLGVDRLKNNLQATIGAAVLF